MTHRVRFSPEAEGQLVGLYGYLAHASTASTAERYVSEVIAFVVGDETVDVIGVFYGGRDFESLLTEA